MEMKHLAIILVSLSIAISSAAQSWSALPWVRTGRGAADLSMAGSAFMSDDNMAWAADGNAAMVPFSADRLSAELGYTRYNSLKTNYFNAGFAYSIKEKAGIAASVSYGFDPAYDVYDETGEPDGAFTPDYILAAAGVSWRFLKFMSIGFNFRYARQSLAEGYTLSTCAGDAVLMCRFADFSISAGAMNLGMPVKSHDGSSFNLASSAKAAMMYDGHFGKNGLQINLDSDWYFSNTVTAALGAQYSWNDILFLRAGYRYSMQGCVIPSFASVGLGLRFFGVRLNAAYIFASEVLDNSFSLSLGYSF